MDRLSTGVLNRTYSPQLAQLSTIAQTLTVDVTHFFSLLLSCTLQSGFTLRIEPLTLPGPAITSASLPARLPKSKPEQRDISSAHCAVPRKKERRVPAACPESCHVVKSKEVSSSNNRHNGVLSLRHFFPRCLHAWLGSWPSTCVETSYLHQTAKSPHNLIRSFFGLTSQQLSAALNAAALVHTRSCFTRPCMRVQCTVHADMLELRGCMPVLCSFVLSPFVVRILPPAAVTSIIARSVLTCSVPY